MGQLHLPGTSQVPEYGTRRKLLKLNPLVDCTEAQLLACTEANAIPTHPLYDQGYASFGCVICSTPVRSGEQSRAGRWRWFNQEVPVEEDKKECGLHYSI